MSWFSFLRNLTELKLSGGCPARTLTIRAEPDRVKELLDHLLERSFVPGPQPGDECEQEAGGEPREEHGGEPDSRSESEFSGAPSPLDRGRYECFLG